MEASLQRRLIHLFGSSAVFTFFNYSLPETAAAFNHQLHLTRFPNEQIVESLNSAAPWRRCGHFYSLLPENATEFKIIDKLH